MKEKIYKLLLVEDEAHLAFTLQFNLEEEGFEVYTATTGIQALEIYNEKQPFHVILMDVMMPELNGFSVLNTIRKKDEKTSILMLTARASNRDRIKGLGLGADDYITKPFNLEELIMKTKRAAKRCEMLQQSNPTRNTTIIEVGDFKLDLDNLVLFVREKEIKITDLESKVLERFFTNPNEIFSRKYFLDKVWKVNSSIETRTVDNFIVRLRKYIEVDPSKPAYLQSVRGRGYKFFIEEAKSYDSEF